MTRTARPLARRPVVVGALALALLGAAGLIVARGVPYVTREARWAIGVYQGPSPFALSPAPGIDNPVLSAAQVTDVPARFVADPFMIRQDATWFMFFEVLNAATMQGDIALATSADGRAWHYERVVLDEPFHLSYPYVLAWDDTYYLIPESAQAREVRLYRADEFPRRWQLAQTLLAGDPFCDPSLVHHAGRWWLFTATHPATNATLALYHADHLEGPWQAHPMSPIVRGDPHRARPGGRIIAVGDRLVRFAQDSAPRYGTQVWAYEITTLTPTAYAERRVGELPIVGPGEDGWNARGMHHVDALPLGAQSWIAAVDGNRRGWALRFWQWR